VTALVLPNRDAAALATCRTTLATGSKSFALATRLLPRAAADRAAIIYTWCRRADDAVDLCEPAHAGAAVARLRGELAWLYAGEPANDPALAAFGEVVTHAAIPISYPSTLLDGMARDATGARYATFEDLYGYCYEVASTVGLMMSHVFGVRDDRALRYAAHLGIAMQLTNICRDIAEDWERGRLYLPDELCAEVGAGELRHRLGEPVAALPRAAVARAVERLLRIADRFYRSGDRGIRALPWRAGLAVRAARAIYARIGRELARRGFDPLAGRAIVPGWRKVMLAASAGTRQLASAPAAIVRSLAGDRPRVPGHILRFPDDVLPV
jgi:phytoene synthase